jgi:hypothetical protein
LRDVIYAWHHNDPQKVAKLNVRRLEMFPSSAEVDPQFSGWLQSESEARVQALMEDLSIPVPPETANTSPATTAPGTGRPN